MKVCAAHYTNYCIAAMKNRTLEVNVGVIAELPRKNYPAQRDTLHICKTRRTVRAQKITTNRYLARLELCSVSTYRLNLTN